MTNAFTKLGRNLLLNPVIKLSLSKVVEFYNNQPVYPFQEDFKSASLMFHVGSVMPLGDNDADALAKVVSMALKENMAVAEVGSWTGMSTGVIGRTIQSKHGHVYAVDHWRGSVDVKEYEVTKKYNILSIFQNNMELLGLSETVHPLVMPSETAASIFKDVSLDLIFIDADHRYTPFKHDLSIWISKLKQGGILCGHDCEGYYLSYPKHTRNLIDNNLDTDFILEVGHPGVIKALYESFNDRHSIMPNSVVWYLRKE